MMKKAALILGAMLSGIFFFSCQDQNKRLPTLADPDSYADLANTNQFTKQGNSYTSETGWTEYRKAVDWDGVSPLESSVCYRFKNHEQALEAFTRYRPYLAEIFREAVNSPPPENSPVNNTPPEQATDWSWVKEGEFWTKVTFTPHAKLSENLNKKKTQENLGLSSHDWLANCQPSYTSGGNLYGEGNIHSPSSNTCLKQHQFYIMNKNYGYPWDQVYYDNDLTYTGAIYGYSASPLSLSSPPCDIAYVVKAQVNSDAEDPCRNILGVNYDEDTYTEYCE